VSAPAGTTVGQLLDEAKRRLAAAHVPDPGREATALVALALATDRGGVLVRKPDAADERAVVRLEALLAARERRVPLQHLTGTTEFCGLELAVGPDALIPRPETEDLVLRVLELPLPEAALVADLGTGSGAIAIALSVARPAWRLRAVDLSLRALGIAAANAARHGVGDRVSFLHRDFGEVPAGERASCHAVASNPPYVAEHEWEGLQAEVRDHEPRLALVPGPTGEEAYASVARAAGALLVPGGWLAFELGWKSEAAVRSIVEDAGFVEIEVRPDLGGIPRVLSARWPR